MSRKTCSCSTVRGLMLWWRRHGLGNDARFHAEPGCQVGTAQRDLASQRRSVVVISRHAAPPAAHSAVLGLNGKPAGREWVQNATFERFWQMRVLGSNEHGCLLGLVNTLWQVVSRVLSFLVRAASMLCPLLTPKAVKKIAENPRCEAREGFRKPRPRPADYHHGGDWTTNVFVFMKCSCLYML